MADQKLPKQKLTNVNIEEIGPIKDGNIKTRELVVAWDEGKRRMYLKMQAKNEKCTVLEKFKPGDEVDITFEIFCSKKHKDDKPYYFQNINLQYIKESE